MWAQLAEKGFTTSPQYWFSDEDRVVVLTQITVGGEQADSADVLTYRDGKLVKFQTAGDTALLRAGVRLQVALRPGPPLGRYRRGDTRSLRPASDSARLAPPSL